MTSTVVGLEVIRCAPFYIQVLLLIIGLGLGFWAKGVINKKSLKKNERQQLRGIIIENGEKEMEINRIWAMPNKRTFSIKPIKELIAQEIPRNEKVLDPFPFDYKKDALDYLEEAEPCLYGLFDPPYSPRQLKECYHGEGDYDTKASTWSKWKDALADKILPNGKVISFGWNSMGLGKSRGFKIEKILLIPHGGMHNDTICVVERKIQTTL